MLLFDFELESTPLVSYPAGHVLRTERPSGDFLAFSWLCWLNTSKIILTNQNVQVLWRSCVGV